MCGIFGVIGSREVSQLIIDGLRKLEYRGYDSSGLATIDNSKKNKFGKLFTRKSKGKLINLSNLIQKKPIQGHLGIGHTRWATHGKPNEINAHPHVDFTGQIAVVQNGIIENYRDLAQSLQLKGIKFASETDTEIIPHLIGLEVANCLDKGLSANGQTLLKADPESFDTLLSSIVSISSSE